jgi:hypothetical protein
MPSRAWCNTRGPTGVGKTYEAFEPVVDREVPPFSMLGDNRLTYEDSIQKTRNELTAALDNLSRAKRSPKTDIMNVFMLAQKVFQRDSRRHILLLLSDMIEDSESADLLNADISDVFIRHLIESRKKARQLPELPGTIVYVAGASAPNAHKMYEIERFWSEYVRATGAEMSPSNYGPALLHFDE